MFNLPLDIIIHNLWILTKVIVSWIIVILQQLVILINIALEYISNLLNTISQWIWNYIIIIYNKITGFGSWGISENGPIFIIFIVITVLICCAILIEFLHHKHMEKISEFNAKINQQNAQINAEINEKYIKYTQERDQEYMKYTQERDQEYMQYNQKRDQQYNEEKQKERIASLVTTAVNTVLKVIS